MSFSPEWEQRYAENTHMSVWPWSDVVSLVHRHCKPAIASGGRVLEFGCGAGANIPLFRALGFDYYGIDGSPTILGRLKKKFPDIAQQLFEGDFTHQQPFRPGFDIVLDRASLTCNDSIAISAGLGLALDALKEGGVFIGVDWYSSKHSESGYGVSCGDEFTRGNIISGQFAGTGKVHFSDEMHLRELFSGFELLSLEEKIVDRYQPVDGHRFAAWNIVARKPHV